MQGKIKLGYWNLRGRGQVPRLLLAYTGLAWEEKTYKDSSEWFGVGDKTKLGLEFPNLPYLISGGFKFTETSAIVRYIIRKSDKKDLLGKNFEDQAKIEMVISLLDDIYNPTYSLFFSPNHEKQKSRLFEGKIKGKLDELAHYLCQRDTTIGYLTLADFRIAEASYYFEKMFPDEYKKFQFFSRIRKTIETLPAIKDYYKKDYAIQGPFLPSYAQLKF